MESTLSQCVSIVVGFFVTGYLNRPGSIDLTENEIRNWLKGIRDSGYNVLGLETNIGDHFYECVHSDVVLLLYLKSPSNGVQTRSPAYSHSYNTFEIASCALQISVNAFTWPDSEVVAKVVSFCGSIVIFAVSTSNFELQNFEAKYLFEAVIQGLTLESNAMIHADLVSLCREIFVHFSNRHSAPREVLLSLPFVTQDSFSAFETALSKESRAKEQKN